MVYQDHAPNGDAEVRIKWMLELMEKSFAKQDSSFGHPENSVQTFQKQIGNLQL